MSVSGKLCTATIGTVSPVTITGIVKGELSETPGELDASDSDSAPYTDTDVGLLSLGASLEMHFRPDGMQYPTLRPGSVLTDLKIYPHGVLFDPFHFPLAQCLAGTTTVEVAGKVVYRINFKNKGTYSVPNQV